MSKRIFALGITLSCLLSLQGFTEKLANDKKFYVAPSGADGFRHSPVTTGASKNLEPIRDGVSSNGQNPYIFHLSTSTPDRYDGGFLQGAVETNWNILKDQEGAVYFAHLEPGGIREPHWHPSAWELNYVISGHATWSILGVQGEHAHFEAGPGDVVFAPQGHFHYFENTSDHEDLNVLIVFNTSTLEKLDDIGIVSSLSVIPPDVLAQLMGVTPEVFKNMNRRVDRVGIIRRKPGLQKNAE